ncbi:MAG: phosphopantetheine-binding protein [Bacteroidales bacterium]|nr:phosphopantetheine-binding protein [Bacteroidales bacterium]
MLDKLKKIFAEVMPNVDASSITEETQLQQDLGINSLSMLLLALSIEKEFDFRFDTVQPFKTVGEVMAYIQEKTK